MNSLRKGYAGLLMMIVFLSPTLVLADTGDIRVECRNLDNDGWINSTLPTLVNPTSTYAIWGNRYIGECASSYYLFDTNQFNFTTVPGAYTTSNYAVTINANAINALDIDGMPALLNAKANASTVGWMTLKLNAMSTTTSSMSTSTIQSMVTGLYDISGQATSSASVAQAYSVQRANHTGTQAASTITGLSAVATTGSYADLSNKPTIDKAYEGTTQRTSSFPVFKNATVASGVAVFHLTTDGTSGGAALFPNGIIQDSIDVEVNDATASFQMSFALSNGNKTVTVTTNKLTTSNILTGILGQAQANGSVVRLVAWGY